MLSISKAQKLISDELKKLVFPEEPKKLYDPIRFILSDGGKRLRPALVLLACDLFGGNYHKAIYPALGIEVFHNFTLLHDDLMDNSSIRRNRPTVHVKWDPNTAILSGDAMSIIANDLICRVDDEKIRAVSRLFSKTAVEVCEGQMLDMEYAQKDSVTISEYINMIRLKTSVLLAASLGIGSYIGGAPEKEADRMYYFGLNLGLAFQLQDDLLDSFGIQDLFGKKIGNDILTNKRTYLVIRAFEKAKGSDLLILSKYFSGFDFDPDEKIHQVISVFNSLDIKNDTQNQITEFHKKALKYLNEVNLSHERKKILLEFSEELIKREK